MGSIHAGAPPDVTATRNVENPLLAAATPLLRALADMPARIGDSHSVAALRHMLLDELHDFRAIYERGELCDEHAEAIRYVLCTALDEAANRTAWGRENDWASHSLSVLCEQDAYGGETVFDLLAKWLAAPMEHMDALEVVYQVLCLGFLGRYASNPDGQREIETIRQRLANVLTEVRPPVATVLPTLEELERRRRSRHGVRKRSPVFPLYLLHGSLGLAIVGLFAAYRHHLDAGVRALEQRLASLDAAAVITPVRSLGLASRLKDDIARGALQIVQSGAKTIVTFRGDDMFGPGQAEMNKSMLPVLDRVAQALAVDSTTGRIAVIGHTDGSPIASGRFRSNQLLSEARAENVADRLSEVGLYRRRIDVIGKGESEPVASGMSTLDRARNRRVEIVVEE